MRAAGGVGALWTLPMLRRVRLLLLLLSVVGLCLLSAPQACLGSVVPLSRVGPFFTLDMDVWTESGGVAGNGTQEGNEGAVTVTQVALLLEGLNLALRGCNSSLVYPAGSGGSPRGPSGTTSGSCQVLGEIADGTLSASAQDGRCFTLFADGGLIQGINCSEALVNTSYTNVTGVNGSLVEADDVNLFWSTSFLLPDELAMYTTGRSGASLNTSLSGFLGAGYSDAAVGGAQRQPFGRLLATAAQVTGTVGTSTEQTFVLDGRADGGSLYLAEFGAAFADDVRWSLTQAGSSPVRAHTMTMFDLQMCRGYRQQTGLPVSPGRMNDTVPVFGNWSKTWNTVLDTGSACMTLPAELYDSLMNWIPVTKCLPKGGFYGPDGTTAIAPGMCFVEPSVAGRLPWMRFRLTEEGTWMYLNMSNLVINYTTGMSSLFDDEFNGLLPLCIRRGSSLLVFSSVTPPEYAIVPGNIVLGSLAMQSFYVVGDFAKRRVGLANKHGTLTEEDMLEMLDASFCTATPQCKGDQVMSSKENSCRDPRCGEWFFTHINADKVCVFKIEAVVIGLLFVVFIGGTEIIAYFVGQFTVKQSLADESALSFADKNIGAPLAALVDRLALTPHERIEAAVLRGERPPPPPRHARMPGAAFAPPAAVRERDGSATSISTAAAATTTAAAAAAAAEDEEPPDDALIAAFETDPNGPAGRQSSTAAASVFAATVDGERDRSSDGMEMRTL